MHQQVMGHKIQANQRRELLKKEIATLTRPTVPAFFQTSVTNNVC
jgi:hypothetical protein